MIIQRILNNNVVIVKNKKGQEEIVCGKGIAFKKKVGEFVDVSAINKVFTLRGRKELEYFQELWEEIPVEYFKVADDVVGMIKLELGKKISAKLILHPKSPIAYDHLSFAPNGLCLLTLFIFIFLLIIFKHWFSFSA